MDKNLRAFVAELIGTFALVFLGAGAVCAAWIPISPAQQTMGVVGIALAGGFALAVALSATLHVSGGFLNPAVTLMLWVFRRIDGVRAIGLIAAQLMGAVLAGAALRSLFNDSILEPARLGTPHLTEAFAQPGTISWLFTGIGIEVVLTFVLTFAIFGTVLDPRGPRLAGLGVGLALTANILMGFHLTGAATNPARWFGTAVWEMTVPTLRQQGPFADHAVYWIGPIVGALLAGLLYSALILPAEEAQRAAPPAALGSAPAPAGSPLARARK